MSGSPLYAVGIDLGTTHCVIAKGNPAALGATRPVTLLDIPQLQAPGEVIERPLLPSFLHLPAPHELPKDSTDLPWGESKEGIVGEMARRRIINSPDRVVHSAKSWLCHDGVDRRIPFLPRSPAELDRRVSPVEASAAYLIHMRRAWDHIVARSGQDKDLLLTAQDIIVTVPASFGEVARQLTVEAARAAGLKRVHLVEEPQAAFYAWMAHHAAELDKVLEGIELILILDVGGGTTDLTLIRVQNHDGEPQLERVAVGEHLMLGGDNMDLALASYAEPRLAARTSRLDGRAWQGLRQSCCTARETLLAEEGPDACSVVIPGRGSSLIGGQLQAELGRKEVIETVLNGFFPFVEAKAKVATRKGLGLREWGLPYTHDTAITRHVAAFLRRYRDETGDQAKLDAVLLNGGVFNSPMVAQRTIDVIHSWTQENPPRLLSTASLDLAVAIGAAHYGLVRRGRGIRIVSGLPRAIYIGLEVRRKKRGGKKRVRNAALCLAPQGLQEGEEVELRDRPLNLTVGREVVFPLYVASGQGGRPGDVRSVDDRSLQQLPSLRTSLPGSGKRQIPVRLRASLSEVGTLDLVAVNQNNSQIFRLEFDLRNRADSVRHSTASEDEATLDAALDPDRIEQARSIIADYFKADSEPPKWKLLVRLEKTLRAKRDRWPLPTIREFFEIVRPDCNIPPTGPPEIVALWYNCVGLCMRPGYGYPRDAERMKAMLPILQGECRAWDRRTRTEWWVLWRRLAGGLERKTQESLLKSVLPYLGLAKAANEYRPSPQELIQIWMLAASLERVSVAGKRDLGEQILRGLKIDETKAPAHGFWCLGRLGSRVPVYAGIEAVLSTDRVEDWLDQLLSFPRARREHYSLALMLLSRRTDDRSRDIDEELRSRVLARLTQEKVSSVWLQMVEQTVQDDPIDRNVLGESLPPGLRLLG